jgi:formate dehydrogenase major subunit
VAGLAASFGSGAMTNDFAGIKEADVILIIGSDTSAAHPVIASRIKQAVRFGKSKLIVIDPKEIDMAKYSAIYARQRCGTDVAVLNGIMHEIIKNGWQDKKYIEERCEGYEELKAAVQDYTPEKVEKISGIPAQKLRDIAALFGKAETASLFYAMGITQHTTGVDNVWSTANLQMLCGNLGKNGGGVNPLRGQCNVQGACDMGALPNVYPGYQKVTDEKAKEKFEKAWGKKLSGEVGLTIPDMLAGIAKGSLKALYVMGENPMLSDPDINEVKKELDSLGFLVVQDIFLTETARMANVVLPAACYAEKDGLYTNTERRAQRLRKALTPPGQAKEDWLIVQEVANAMGSDWNYSGAHDIAEEVRALTPQYGGISWERVGTQGLQWPCPTLDHPGTPYLHKGKFARGKGLMKAIPFKEPAELPDKEYPLVLTTGRLLEQFHTATMTRKSEGLNNLAGPMVMISAADAEELKISDGETVLVASRRGKIQTPAFVTDKIGKGTIYIPFHFHEAAANTLTNPVYDPVAKIPEYKACAAKVSKL